MECSKICTPVGNGSRSIGCQRPFETVQIVSIVVQAVGVVGFLLVLLSGLESTGEYIGLLSLYSLCLVILVLSYTYCLISDPSKPSIFRCNKISQNNSKEERYCSVCKKKIRGLDHHCEWLANCISENNYFAFFTLILSGFLTFTLQIITVILQLTLFNTQNQKDAVEDRYGRIQVHYALAALSCLYSFALVFRYFSLLRYHINLLRLGMGTYDYLLAQREALMAQRDKEKQDQENQDHYLSA
mmetsp:Transcript_11909/g.13720  ORF Transcript_11909/g.13720 Transcript_11909/m.13720 type:complete len:243 (+) Transcript_11909:122-850(+)